MVNFSQSRAVSIYKLEPNPALNRKTSPVENPPKLAFIGLPLRPRPLQLRIREEARLLVQY